MTAKPADQSNHQSAKTKKVTLTLNVTVVAVDSNYDDATQAGFAYREKHVYPYFEAKGFTVRKFQGPLARRHYVAPDVKKPEVDYITGAGHGLADQYLGDFGNVIFQVGNYQADEVDGRIVHFLSCQTARQLGPDFVAKGCRAYFGYDENFAYQPAYSEIFFACDSEIDLAFADGLDAAAVYNRVRKLYNREIAKLRAAGKLYAAATLEFDRDHLRCPSSGGAAWGDPAAKLS
jgi:hypothetical protein